MPESKYYDIYAFSSEFNNYNRRILGDATGEMGPFVWNQLEPQWRLIRSWYGDEGWYLENLDPLFRRGGDPYSDIGSGIFTFVHVNGSAVSNLSYQTVLAF